MTADRWRRTRWGLAVLAVFVACGESLIEDPSFDLWCGDMLCKPWQVEGTISKVQTWHRSDFGVSLMDGAVISQLSKKHSVSCIEFEVIADVDAASEVKLEMDFDDNGSSEYQQLIPESHWAKLRFLVTPPHWYDRLRFILRKTGRGRAVLAQIKATSSDDCDGPPLPATDRPNGAECSSAGECASGVCQSLERNGAARSCGECSESSDCAADAVCGLARSDYGPYRACVPPGETEVGARCFDAAECQSGLCTRALGLASTSCAECERDDECAEGQVCGISVNERGPARVCRPLHTRGLGELCAVDAECESEVCGLSGCAECSLTHPCANQGECSSLISNIPGQWFAGAAQLCDARSHARQAGEPCNHDEDCASDACDLPAPICYLCDGDNCQDMNTATCGQLRRLAGVCR